ncbi:MAG: hypothetical protein AAGC86_03570, partial [Pseudomonadota bacterium]
MKSGDYSICVYCGARDGTDPAFATAAEDLGRLIAEAGCRLVYGAGDIGLMGRVAGAAKGAADFNRKHHATDRVAAATSSAIESARAADDKYGIVSTARNAARDGVARARAVDDKYHVVDRAKEAS